MSFFKTINFKSGLVYFLLIQVIVLVCAFFLPMGIVPLLRFIFAEVGQVRDAAEIIVMLIIELLARFFVFYSTFKNNRTLSFKEFSLSYSVAFVLRLIFSLITSFAAWSAGMAACLSGVFFGTMWIDEGIKTMRDVPVWLYLIIFVAFEGLVWLIARFSLALAKRERARLKKELTDNKE